MNRLVHVLAATASLLLSACASSPRTDEVPARLTAEGLLALEVETLESVLVHPGADFASFTDLVIESPTVEFRDGWQPVTTGSRLGISEAERDEARDKLQSVFMEGFRQGLLENDRLRIVAEEAPGVLSIAPVLTNVTISNLGSSGNVGQTMVRKYGDVRLSLVIRDVRTGTVIARIDDERVVGKPSSGYGITGSNATYTQFARLFEAWGRFVGKAIMNISPQFDDRS